MAAQDAASLIRTLLHILYAVGLRSGSNGDCAAHLLQARICKGVTRYTQHPNACKRHVCSISINHSARASFLCPRPSGFSCSQARAICNSVYQLLRVIFIVLQQMYTLFDRVESFWHQLDLIGLERAVIEPFADLRVLLGCKGRVLAVSSPYLRKVEVQQVSEMEL